MRVDSIASTSSGGFTGTNNNFEILTTATNTNNICLERLMQRVTNTNTDAVLSTFPQGAYLAEPQHLVNEYLKLIKFNYTDNDISNVRVLQKKPGTNTSSSSTTTPVSIAITCANSSVLRKLLNTAKTAPPVKLASLNIPGTSIHTNQRIFISELLTSQVFKLLGKTKHMLKPIGFKYIWAKCDMVHAKKSDNSIRHTLLNEEDISKLVQLYSDLPPQNTTSPGTTPTTSTTTTTTNTSTTQ